MGKWCFNESSPIIPIKSILTTNTPTIRQLLTLFTSTTFSFHSLMTMTPTPFLPICNSH